MENMPAQKVKIEKLVSGGYGLGYLDGRVIFVPYSAPDDELLVEVAPNYRGVSWGNIKQILSPSASRISPFCTHYTLCGGCQLQHISYPDQLAQKRLILADTLSRLAGLNDISIASCIGSPLQIGYRNKVKLHCKGKDIGFYKPRSNNIIPVNHCPMLSDKINTCLRQFSEHIFNHPLKGPSEIHLMQDSDDQVILTIKTNSLLGKKFKNKLQNTVSASGALLCIGHKKNLLWGQNYSYFSLDGKGFRVSSGTFFQANISLLSELIQQLLKVVKPGDIGIGAELYAGVGVFSTILSKRAEKMLAVEWNRRTAEDAIVNFKSNQIKNVDIIPMSAEDGLDFMVSRNIKPELLLANPTREGLSNAVCQKLIQLLPQQLIYISCNPATLARDIKFILASGAYQLKQIIPLDMFPHTSHVESVCSLIRN